MKVKSIALLTESVTSQARSANPLELLPPRERAVVTLLGAGMGATTVAKLLCISRDTLYEDRRRAWRTLAPIIPGAVLTEYNGHVVPWRRQHPAPSPANVPDEDSD